MRLAVIATGLAFVASCSSESPKPADAGKETPVTLSTGDTTVQLGPAIEGVSYPAGTPAYPGGHAVAFMRVDAQPGAPQQVQVSVETFDAAETVAAFYKTAMADAGFELKTDLMNPGGGVLQAELPDRSQSVMVQVAETEGKTVVVIAGSDPEG